MAQVVDTIIWRGVLDTSKANFAGFGSKARKEMSGIQKSMSALNSELGRGLTTAGKILFNFGKDSVKALAEFESAFIDVAKKIDLEGTFDDATTELGSLARAIREVALADLQGTIGAVEFTQIAAGSAQLGVAAENLLGFSTGVGQVAVALETDVGRTSTALAKIIQQFDLSQTQEQVLSVGSAINEVSQGSVATANEIFDAVGRMTGSATAMGISVEEIIGITGALRNEVPLSVRKTATAMNRFLLSMKTDTAAYVQAFGLDAEEFAALMQDKPVEALNQVIEAMGKMADAEGPEQLLAAMKKLDDEEAGTSMLEVMQDILGTGDGVTQLVLNLAGAQDEIRSQVGLATQAAEENISVINEFANVAGTQENRFKLLNEQWTEMQRRGGEVLKPFTDFLLNTAIGAMDELLNNGENFVNVLAQSINESFGGMKILPEQLGGLYAGFFSDVEGHLDELHDHAGQVVTEMAVMMAEPFIRLSEKLKSLDVGLASLFIKSNERLKQFDQDLVSMFKGPDKKLEFGAEDAIEDLKALKGEFGGVLAENEKLNDLYKVVWKGMEQAIGGNMEPSERLQQQFSDLTQTLETLGVVSHGGSVFPDMEAAILSAEVQTQSLDSTMDVLTGTIDQINDDVENTAESIRKKQESVRNLEIELRNLNVTQSRASKQEKKALETTKKALQNKRALLLNEISMMRTQQAEQKATLREEKSRLTQTEQQHKKVSATIRRLIKERTKAEQEAVKERKRLEEEAFDKVSGFLEGLNEEAREWVLSGEEGIKALQKQGVLLSVYDEKAIDRVRQEQQAAEELERQQASINSMVASSASLVENFSSMSDTLGGLGGSLGNIGDILGISELGQAGEAVGSLGQLSELPQMISQLAPQLASLGGELNGVYQAVIAVAPQLATLGPIAAGAAVAWAAWEYLPEPIAAIISPLGIVKKLFEDTTSEGTKAAQSWQEFVATTIEGGEALVGPMEQARESMDFHDQIANLDGAGQSLLNTLTGFGPMWTEQVQDVDAAKVGFDRFGAAIATATGNWEKAPQVALQTIDALENQGFALHEVLQRMAEMTAASLDTNAASEEFALIQDVLADSTSLTAQEVSTLETRMLELQSILDSIPETKEITVSITQKGQVPQLAAGGEASGLAIVNEQGPEIAKLPGGSMALITGQGPQLMAFPNQTQIIPHGRSMAMLRRNPMIPRMQAGGTVTNTNASVVNNININGGLIDRATIKQIFTGLRQLEKRRG